jgi:hypothetical protein
LLLPSVQYLHKRRRWQETVLNFITKCLPAEGTTAAFGFLRESARSAGGFDANAKQILCLREEAVMSHFGSTPRWQELSGRKIPEAFHKGLHDVGFTEDRNVAIEYRWAESQYARLPELAAELVQHKMAVIVATGITATRAAKAATSTIPY